MKRLLCILLILWAGRLKAQNGSQHLTFEGGVGVPLLDLGRLGYEFNSLHHRRHEVFLEWMKTKETDYQTVLLGLLIKPVIFRRNATSLRFRAGSALGTDFSGLIIAPLVGWEFSWVLLKRLELCLGSSSQLLLWAKKAEQWRVVLDAGIKIPLN
ncbi:hypothetical protein [Cyclobacterium plantarum]|uniref:hypothetical protein n=1 Tax=Cyclobacterium plantarum TaxID=2716263 RepID=UPI003F7179CB